MIFEPKIFYQTYLKDYHQIKAIYLMKMLDKLDEKYEEEFFGNKLDGGKLPQKQYGLKVDKSLPLKTVSNEKK